MEELYPQGQPKNRNQSLYDTRSILDKQSADELSQDSENEDQKVLPGFKRYQDQNKHGKLVQFNKLSKKDICTMPPLKYNHDGPAFESNNLNFEMIQGRRNTKLAPTF